MHQTDRELTNFRFIMCRTKYLNCRNKKTKRVGFRMVQKIEAGAKSTNRGTMESTKKDIMYMI